MDRRAAPTLNTMKLNLILLNNSLTTTQLPELILTDDQNQTFLLRSKKYLTKAERSQIVLSKELKEISVGLILGDLNVRKLTANSLLQFSQGVVHADYLQHLYELFEVYCKSAPKTIYSAPDPLVFFR